MGFFDRLFGDDTQQQQPAPRGAAANRSDDEIAVERYRYLLKTAPPEAIEQVHAEAFSKLTPEQRDILFVQLQENAAAGDAPTSKEPQALAVSATRSELRNPGTMERTLGGNGGQGVGLGGIVMGSLLGTVAGYVIGSAIVGSFMPDPAADASADAGTDASGDAGTDASADTASADGGDFGSDSGGDFGGGDFGGGFGDFGF